MKVSIIRFVFAVVFGLMAIGANAEEGLHLSIYFSHATNDPNPSTENVTKYSIYLTERGDQELSAIQSAVLNNPAVLSDYVYICHAVFWNTECSQYATLDMTQDATDETVLDGRYECTANTVAIVVYEDGSHREVLVLPGADSYFYEFFDDWEQPGTGWSEGNGGSEPPVAISMAQQAHFTAYSASGSIIVKGAMGAKVEVFNVMGTKVSSAVASSDNFRFQAPAAGVYVVRVNGVSKKILVH